jgi:hypothetical protein
MNNNTQNTTAKIRSMITKVGEMTDCLDAKIQQTHQVNRHNDLRRIMRSNTPQPTTRKVDIVDALRSIQATNA